ADFAGSRRDVSDVPKAAVSNRSKAALFDHLVGAGEQRRWHFEAERLAGHAFVARQAALKDLTLDHLSKDRLHVCFRKRSQRLRANVSKGATAQSKRSDGCIIRVPRQLRRCRTLPVSRIHPSRSPHTFSPCL